jgi:UDP-GlcNAc:undecaprenyl-phosphate GlcNAc-1-phosphate transferase
LILTAKKRLAPACDQWRHDSPYIFLSRAKLLSCSDSLSSHQGFEFLIKREPRNRAPFSKEAAARGCVYWEYHLHLDYLSLAVALFATALLSGLVFAFGGSLASRVGLVDIPGGRKRHHGAVPLTGGAGLFLGILCGILIIRPQIEGFGALASALTLLFITGLVDDHRDLPALVKLLLQICAAVIVVHADSARIGGLGNLFYAGPLNLGWFSEPFTVVCIVAYVNALNMSDGIDGLAGSVALVAIAALMVATGRRHFVAEFQLLALFASGLLVFLVFNARHPLREKAGVFLGDSGSLLVGFFVAWAVIHVAVVRQHGPIVTSSAALWIVGLPAIDLIVATTRRIIRRRSPFSADREHLHHILLAAGFSVNSTVAIIAGTSAAMAAIGLIGMYAKVNEIVMFAFFLAFLAACAYIFLRAWHMTRILQSIRKRFARG